MNSSETLERKSLHLKTPQKVIISFNFHWQHQFICLNTGINKLNHQNQKISKYSFSHHVIDVGLYTDKPLLWDASFYGTTKFWAAVASRNILCMKKCQHLAHEYQWGENSHF